MGHGLCQHTRGRAIDGDICFGEGYDKRSQEKYFPDCCQHELLFLAELFRGQVGRGAAADTNWIGGM